MADFAIVAVIIIIAGLAIFYVYKSKKSGKKCAGCPGGCFCSEEQKNACSCGCEDCK